MPTSRKSTHLPLRGRRTLPVLMAATLLASTLTGCIISPGTAQTSQPTPTQTQTQAQTSQPAPAPTQTSSPEDQFMRDARLMTPQPHLLPSVRSELLVAGYSVCDAWYEGNSRASIIEVTHYSLGVDRNPDLFYPDAATVLTDAALTHLC